MSNNEVASPTAPGGDSPGGGQPSLMIQSREEITAHQVSILLSIAQAMRNIVVTVADGENDKPCKESQIAAERTLFRACERLQDLVDDGARWSLRQNREVHKAIIAAHKKQEELIQVNINVLEMHKRPSYILKPQIATYGDQYFIAFFGQIERPGMAIVGRGKTPSEALLDFDKAFHRTPPQQFRLIAEQQDKPKPEPSAETPEDFKKQNPPPPDER